QQHLEELNRRRAVRRRPEPFQARENFWIALEPSLDRFDDLFAPARAFKSLRQRAQVPEPLDRRRRLYGNVAYDLILDHAAARSIATLGFTLAPGGNFD